MKQEHRAIQHWIAANLRGVYQVAAEVSAKNCLPSKELCVYQPDVLVRNKAGKIVYIIEVEGRPTRKSITGACVLADYAVSCVSDGSRPRLIFVLYDPKGIKQIDHYTERTEIARKYTPHLKGIRVLSFPEFKRTRL